MGKNATSHTYKTFSKPAVTNVPLKRITLIVNPSSGSKRSVRTMERIKPLLEASEFTVTVVYTERPGHARVLARDLDLSETDCLCALGGDGTVHEITNGLLERPENDEARLRVVLAMVPCGSGNTVAHDLGLSTINESVACLMRGTVRSVDVALVERLDKGPSATAPSVASENRTGTDSSTEQNGQVADGATVLATVQSASSSASPEPALQGADDSGKGKEHKRKSLFRRSKKNSQVATVEVENPLVVTAQPDMYPNTCYAINIIGYGLPASLLRRANGLRWLGSAQYQIAAYMALIKNVGYRCTINIVGADDEKIVVKGDFSMVQAQVTVHMGEKMPFCPRAKLDDGLLDLVLIRRASRFQLAMIIESAKLGNHVNDKLVEYYHCKSIEILPELDETFQGDETINIDGELVGGVPVRVTALPAVVRFVTGEPGFGPV